MSHVRRITNLLPQPVRYGLRRVLFYGRKQRCLLCNNRIRGFRDHGSKLPVLVKRHVAGGLRREQDRCPVCHACDRTRLLKLFLETRTNIGKEPTRLLHVAPDFGLYLWLRTQPNVDYFATDLDGSRFRHIEGMISADLTDLPFDSDGFDIIICSHVLEHVPDDATAFQEIFRVLKPGGVAALLTPFALDGAGTDEEPTINDPVEQERRFGQWDHVRIYDRDDFLQRMTASGFETILYDPFQEHPENAQSLHLNPDEKLPLGFKPAASIKA